jgi:methylated-DNA-[protein]-cysteine S-methyltransferase
MQPYAYGIIMNNDPLFFARFDTSFCEIILVGNSEGLTNLHLNTGEGKRKFEISDQWKSDSHLFSEAIQQVKSYFAGELTCFSLPLNPQGTEFQKQVWQQLIKIPYGETRSYKDIAVAIGNDKAVRAVGMANGKNPLPLFVPCHRVIGSNGKLTGFAHGLAMKEKLLTLELKTLSSQSE